MKLLLTLLVFTTFAHASSYDLQMTCGEVKSAGNGKILKRLEPSVFGINAKYVLKTKFSSYVEINESGAKIPKEEILDLINDDQTALTYFSDKAKFNQQKSELQKAIKLAKKQKDTLYACVGRLHVHPFKYTGSQVFFSTESVEAAAMKMRKLAKKHL